MTATAYIPDQGHTVWLEFTPQSGHEQAGTRPALVLSPAAYNSKAGLMLCCPITNQIKGYPFEVQLKGVRSTSGVVLADQMKSLDWAARHAQYKGKVPSAILKEVIEKISILLDYED